MARNSSRGNVSVEFVREVARCIDAQGLDSQAFIAAAGIPQALLAAPQARVTAENFGQLWLAVAQALDDEFFGLDLRRMKVGTYAALSRQAIRCATLGEALQGCAAWLNLILDESHLELLRDGHDAVLQIDDAPGARPATRRNRTFAHEALLVMIYGLACWLIDRHIALRSLALAYPRPARAPEYDIVFAAGAQFDAPATRLCFAASVLHAPVTQNPKNLRDFLRAAPANFILRYRNEGSPAARIRHRLQNTTPEQWPSFTALAREMGTAPSTLHRQLAREGARFGTIRDALRRDHAIERLVSSRAPISRIAEELGFAEPGGFYRAFRKWTGARPGDYRSRQRHSVSAAAPAPRTHDRC